MRVTDNVLIETHTYVRHIAIEGAAPILVQRASYGGKQFVPDCVTAKWTHGEPIKEITIGGYVLKQDRTTGKQRASMRYITPAHVGWGRPWDAPAPQWLLDLFADSPHTSTPPSVPNSEGAAE